MYPLIKHDRVHPRMRLRKIIAGDADQYQHQEKPGYGGGKFFKRRQALMDNFNNG